MIIIQTPLRISLFGGGTDFPAYFMREGGCVLTTTIDKYIYVAIKKRFDEKIRVGYTQTEIADTVDQLQHELIRESLRMVPVEAGVEIVTMGDVPAGGSGLGSSSAVTVGTLQALYTYRGESVAAEDLARKACQIEVGILHKSIGLQDQYISALGGVRYINFSAHGVTSEKLHLAPGVLQDIGENLMLFYTGVTRSSHVVLHEQQKNIANHLIELRELKKLVELARKELERQNVDALGDLLHRSWGLKRMLSSAVSNEKIDLMYETARTAGALGGKISGAGGGGFLLLYVPPVHKNNVRTALKGFHELTFRLEPDGSKVILNYRR